MNGKLKRSLEVELERYPFPKVKATLPAGTSVELKGLSRGYLCIVREGTYARWVFKILSHQRKEIIDEQENQNP